MKYIINIILMNCEYFGINDQLEINILILMKLWQYVTFNLL